MSALLYKQLKHLSASETHIWVPQNAK